MPRSAEDAGALHAGRPRADDEDVASRLPRPRLKRSGCQPRRYSSPIVGFWVQMIEARCS